MEMANPIDCQLRNLLLLPLEDVTLRRVAIILFRDPIKYRHLVIEAQIKRSDREFKSAVAELGLPKSMRDQVINVMCPIFQEIFKWSKFHKRILESNGSFYPCEYVKYVHWTCMGSINYQKTAEAMIRNENVEVVYQFMLACLYCMEDDIQDLWQKLCPQSREHLNTILKFYRFRLPFEIITLWICILKGRVEELEDFLMDGFRRERRYSSIYQYAFETFALKGYETATRYFFEKLTSEEKDASLVRTAKAVARNDRSTVECRDVFCYLLSQMNAEQLQNVLENSSKGILRIFLEWPRQEAFPEVAKLASPYLDQDDFEHLHRYLAQKYKYLHNAPKLFRDLFLISSKVFRPRPFYLLNLFRDRDTENIKLMLRDLKRVERLQLLFHYHTLFMCRNLVEEGEWYILEFFIRECRLPEADRAAVAGRLNSYLASRLKPELLEMFNRLMCDISNDEELIGRSAKKKDI